MPHWRHMMSSTHLHAADLQGKDAVVTIERVTQGEFPDFEDPKNKLKKPELWFKGKKKPLGLNSTNARTISKLFGSSKTEDWVGKSITLYPTTTMAFGEEHECIRIRKRLPNERDARAAAAPVQSTATSGSGATIDQAGAELAPPAEPPLTDAERRAIELADREAGR